MNLETENTPEDVVETASPASEPTPAPQEADEDRPLSASDIEELLRFDPMAKPSKPAETPPADKDTPPNEAPKGQQTVTPEGNPKANDDLIAQLRAQVDTLSAQVKTVQQPKQQPQEQAEEFPRYDFAIPDEIMGAISSEDPRERKMGMSALMHGALTAVHKNLREEMLQIVRVLPQQMQTVVGKSQEAKQVHDDFYGAHPELNNPMLKPLVVQASALVAQQNPGMTYGAAMREKIAQTVYATLKWPEKGQTVKPTQKAPPKQFGGNTRSAGAEPASEETQDIMATLFTGM